MKPVPRSGSLLVVTREFRLLTLLRLRALAGSTNRSLRRSMANCAAPAAPFSPSGGAYFPSTVQAIRAGLVRERRPGLLAEARFQRRILRRDRCCDCRQHYRFRSTRPCRVYRPYSRAPARSSLHWRDTSMNLGVVSAQLNDLVGALNVGAGDGQL